MRGWLSASAEKPFGSSGGQPNGISPVIKAMESGSIKAVQWRAEKPDVPLNAGQLRFALSVSDPRRNRSSLP
jgi:hypothetical protein